MIDMRVPRTRALPLRNNRFSFPPRYAFRILPPELPGQSSGSIDRTGTLPPPAPQLIRLISSVVECSPADAMRTVAAIQIEGHGYAPILTGRCPKLLNKSAFPS